MVKLTCIFIRGQRMLLASEALKQEGNTLFGQQAFSEASVRLDYRRKRLA
jgi:hypothetical protein